jgi:glucokinase
MSSAPFTALGIDVGGTKIASGLVAFPTGVTRPGIVIPTRVRAGNAAMLEDIVTLARNSVIEAERREMRVDAVGLGLCELVGPDGQILSGCSLDFRDLPLFERFSVLAPVIVEADVRAGALAEALFGAGKEWRTFLYVTVGTGISCCLMIDGKAFVGARGATGTMASSPVHFACAFCGEVSAQTLEEIASGPALLERYRHGSNQMAQTGQDVLAAAHEGDPVAVQVVKSAGSALGVAVGNLVNVLDPEAVVIGGGLGCSEGLYWESMVQMARAQIWSEIHRELPIVRAVTGANAGWIGAAAAAWQRAGPAIS